MTTTPATITPFYLRPEDLSKGSVEQRTVLYFDKPYDVGNTKVTKTKIGKEFLSIELIPLTIDITDNIETNMVCVPYTNCQVLKYTTEDCPRLPIFLHHPDWARNPKVKVDTLLDFRQRIKQGYRHIIDDVYDLDYEYVTKYKLIGLEVETFRQMVNSGKTVTLIEKHNEQMVQKPINIVEHLGNAQAWIEQKKILLSMIINSSSIEQVKARIDGEDWSKIGVESYGGYEAVVDDLPFEATSK
jgi:hypothetical protein